MAQTDNKLAAEKFLASVDRSDFNLEPYKKIVPKPWGHEVHLTEDSAPYMAKILHIKADARISLQAHDQKTETWCMLSGEAAVLIENSNGEMDRVVLKPGVGYTTKIGQLHRLVGVTDCDIFEASTRELGTTWRLEDDYARPDETEEMRTDPNRGWNG